MNAVQHIKRVFHRFRSEEDGTASIELLLCFPLLVYALLSTLVYFHAFRYEAISERAGLTVADMFSREAGDGSGIDANYLENSRDLLRQLALVDSDPDLRVTFFEYSTENDAYQVVWSENLGFGSDYTNDELNQLSSTGNLPIMADGERSILVQTRVEYISPVSVSIAPWIVRPLQDVVFQTYTVIRPRYTNTLCWHPADGSAPLCGDDGDGSTTNNGV